MGCGSSSRSSIKAFSVHQKPLHDQKASLGANNSDTKSILKEFEGTDSLIHTKDNTINNAEHKTTPEELVINETQERDKNNRLNDIQKGINRKSVSMAGVAFEVKLEENLRTKELRRPPKLQKLENVTVLTADMLARKQTIAEENRQKEIKRKLEKTSRRKKKLLEAREIDKAENKLLEIKENMDTKSKKRAKLQEEIIRKQRRRELRAKQVRARAEKIREAGDEVDFDVDPDNTYNADEEDQSWDMEKSENQQYSTKSHPKKNIPQLEEQEEHNRTQRTDDTTQSVYDFFEE